MQEEVIYRCINPACARPMPRPVNFCPWCGTAQGRGPVRTEADLHARQEDVGAAVAANAGAAAAAALSGWSDAPEAPVQPAQSPVQPQPQADPPVQRREGVRATVQSPRVPPSATDFGRSASSGRGTDTGAARQEVPRPPIAARPARRKPVQLRWWILALAILWAVWLLAKPSPKKIERQIEHAAALARECKGSEAQAELIALGRSRATPEQLERLQKTLNDQSAICTKRRQRNKAWGEASTAAEAALDAGSPEKARTRLQGFIRRWGEDDKTRALKGRIDEAAERAKHPLAVPPDGAGGRRRVKIPTRDDYRAYLITLLLERRPCAGRSPSFSVRRELGPLPAQGRRA